MARFWLQVQKYPVFLDNCKKKCNFAAKLEVL